MVNIKLAFHEMIQELKEKEENEVYKLKILTAETPVLIAGIDGSNLNRQLYIDLGLEPWEKEQLKALPKWRGLSIRVQYIEKISLLREHYFLILTQEAEYDEEIFNDVLQNLVDHLRNDTLEESLFSRIYKVLDRWRGFFQRGGFKRLSEEEQRGLFGELWFIQEWLDKCPGEPPLLIEHWEGPTKGRIDFKSSKIGIEIKTVKDKISKTIKISNENQLKISEAISSIYLYVCFLEQSKTHGISLQNLVEEVRNKVAERSDRLALIYNDLLTSIGFREEEYTDTFYFVEKVELYEAEEEFPRITKDYLPKGISHVSYNIDLSHCTEFKRDANVFDQFFRLEGS